MFVINFFSENVSLLSLGLALAAKTLPYHISCVLFQHLVWILGLKPSAGGSLKAGQQLNDSTNAVITTAVMADLPVLSSMLSRLFESSQ